MKTYLDGLTATHDGTKVFGPGAPVSFPLTWDQVKPGLDPKRWTIRTAASDEQHEDWGRPCFDAVLVRNRHARERPGRPAPRGGGTVVATGAREGAR